MQIKWSIANVSEFIFALLPFRGYKISFRHFRDQVGRGLQPIL